jgi:hypothetical protein
MVVNVIFGRSRDVRLILAYTIGSQVQYYSLRLTRYGSACMTSKGGFFRINPMLHLDRLKNDIQTGAGLVSSGARAESFSEEQM